MGQRRDRLNHRMKKHEQARKKNARRKNKERVRRAARIEAKAAAAAGA